MKTTETLDKVYLEWSQFTEARTMRELALTSSLETLLDYLATHFVSDELSASLAQHRLILNQNR